ncbi:MAG: helicase, partial [Pseudonocardia sp.]|nr:helicase [Pseudonocardia sp.]
MTTSVPQLTTRREERPPFTLTHEPDGRSWTARENLADILERELLGPANGPDELLNGSPDAAYLVGRIAPARLTAGREDPTSADDTDAATDVGDAVDADEGRGVPVTAVDESAASADEDSAEDQPQQRGLMIPASMGLRFQIPTDLDTFTVLATWGTYKSVGDERPESRGRKYQRTPMEFPTTVRVAGIVPGTTKEYPLHDKVVLRVDRYDDAERGCRMIEVALCNDKVTPRKIPVDAWLYQTRLTVDAGGAEVFLPVTDALLDTRDERDDELRRLRLQYRDRLEFALGRTCSVDWAVAPKARRATSVWTTWLPTSETPQ